MIQLKLASPHRARPLAPAALLFALAVAGHALIVGCGGGQQAANNETPPDNAATTPPAGSDTTSTASTGPADGAKIYADRCALCHGPEGKGDGPASAGLNPKPRNHTDGTYMLTRTDEDLTAVIRDGKGGMPAWGSVLSEPEIVAVLAHVRGLAK